MECMRQNAYDSRVAARNRQARRMSEGGVHHLHTQHQHQVWNTWHDVREPSSGGRESVWAPGNIRLSRYRDGPFRPSGYSVVAGDDIDADIEGRAEAVDHKDRSAMTWGEAFIELSSGTHFQVFMALCIMANAVVIGLETDIPEFEWWEIIETSFLVIFAIELICRVSAHGYHEYFDSNGVDFSWNVFDFLIVTVGVCDTVANFFFRTDDGAATVFRIVRLLRILRVFRIVRFLKHLYMLAFGFGLAAIAIFWVTVLMVFLLYVCAVVLVRTVGYADAGDNPTQAFLHHRFGNIATSMLTLFELMSSPDLTPYHDVLGTYPMMSIFLIVFIIFGSFGMIALLTGVISEAMFEKNQLRIEEENLARCNVVEHCKALFKIIDTDGDRKLTKDELQNSFHLMADFFESEGVDCVSKDLETLFNILDVDQNGEIDAKEFCEGLSQIAEGVRPLLVMETGYKVSSMKRKLKNMEEELLNMKASMRDFLREALTGYSDSVACQTRLLSSSLGDLERKVDKLISLNPVNSQCSVLDNDSSSKLIRLCCDLQDVVANHSNYCSSNAQKLEGILNGLKNEVCTCCEQIKSMAVSCSSKDEGQASAHDYGNGQNAGERRENVSEALMGALSSLRAEVEEIRYSTPSSIQQAIHQQGCHLHADMMDLNRIGLEGVAKLTDMHQGFIEGMQNIVARLQLQDDRLHQMAGQSSAKTSFSCQHNEKVATQELPAILQTVAREFTETPLLSPDHARKDYRLCVVRTRETSQ